MNKKIKILMYAHLYGEDASGMTLSNLELAKGLSEQGHLLEVIACRGETSASVEKRLAFKVTFLPKWKFSSMSSIYGRGLLNWFFLFWYNRTIKDRLNSLRPDIVFVADETANCFWGVWAFRNPTPYVSYCSVPYLHKWKEGALDTLRKSGLTAHINRILYKFLLNSYRYSQRILVVSGSTEKELIRGSGRLKGKIHVLPRSINSRYFDTEKNISAVNELKSKFKIVPNDFILFSATRITYNKGIDDVLTSLGMLSLSLKKKIKYIIAGDGPARSFLEKMSVNLGIANRVFFTGSIPHQELIPYYDLCDLYVLPSKRGSSESFGRVFVEAASRSKPSIGSLDGGIKDIIVEGVTGFLVPARDTQLLHDRISNLALDREKAKIMGKNARLRAQEKYTTEAVSGELSRHFIEVLNPHIS